MFFLPIPVLVAIPLTLGAMILWEHPYFTWHDQQRMGQIFLSVLCLVSLFQLGVARRVRLAPLWQWMGASILFFGICSTALASYPLMAGAEVGLLVISIGIGGFAFYMARRFAGRFDLIFGGFLRLLLAALVLGFYVSCISAFTQTDLYFHPWALFNGFSNVRFEGQFLTIVAPLLWANLYASAEKKLSYPRYLDSILVASLVCMVFVSGTRGSVFAWLATSLLFLLLGGGARKLGKQVFIHMAAGYLLAVFILYAHSWVTGQSGEFRFDGAQIFGLSSREVLWKGALETILKYPLLGVGPMHFAELGIPIAAHPHQALLQFASEWGLPTCLLVIFTFSIWSYRCVANALHLDSKHGADLRWALLLSVFSACGQSMVDGVLVMPYPQIWLSIIVGWAAARCLPNTQEMGGVPRSLLLLIWGSANILLIAVALNAYPKLVGAPELSSLGGPRFWCEGSLNGPERGIWRRP